MWDNLDWDRSISLFSLYTMHTSLPKDDRSDGLFVLWSEYATADEVAVWLDNALFSALDVHKSEAWARILRFRVRNNSLYRLWMGVTSQQDRTSDVMRKHIEKIGFFDSVPGYLDICKRDKDAVRNAIAVASRLNMTHLFEDLRLRLKVAHDGKEPDLYEGPFNANDEDFTAYRHWYSQKMEGEPWERG